VNSQQGPLCRTVCWREAEGTNRSVGRCAVWAEKGGVLSPNVHGAKVGEVKAETCRVTAAYHGRVSQVGGHAGCAQQRSRETKVSSARNEKMEGTANRSSNVRGGGGVQHRRIKWAAKVMYEVKQYGGPGTGEEYSCTAMVTVMPQKSQAHSGV